MTDLLDQPLITLRAINVAVTIFTAAGLAVVYNADWHRLATGLRIVVGGEVLLLLAGAYGSAEQLHQDAPAGWRTLLVTVACLVILTGLVLHRRELRRTRR